VSAKHPFNGQDLANNGRALHSHIANLMSPQSFGLAVVVALTGLTWAAAPHAAEGVHFVHKDWELACDNTGTCRAAGFQEDSAELPVSILVTRPPGPRTRPTVELMLGSYQDHPAVTALPPNPVLTMWVNGRSLGAVRLGESNLIGTLSPVQTAALLQALPRAQAEVSWRRGEATWAVSDQGARAVLLKMDEAQGRLNTPGALVARGTRDERQVPGARPPALLQAAAVPPTTEADRTWPARQGPALLAALRATVADSDCDRLLEDAPTAWEVRRLSEQQLLVSAPCWLAAYNFGAGAWVVNERPPYAPVLVTDSASYVSDNEVTASHKGRGLGDCNSSESWVWDGQRFRRSAASTTGQCKFIGAGGAWELPTWVTRPR